jgi:diguanylate cyclase (GGDEF)-like protein/PAS domain S-box-containing protein
MLGRIYTLPVLLFCVLTLFSAGLASYIQLIEHRSNSSKASIIAHQISSNLEVFSADRLRAIDDLLASWPVYHANPIDWFNVRANTLAKVLPGFKDIVLADPQLRMQWSIDKTNRQHRLGQSLTVMGLTAVPVGKMQFSTGFYLQDNHQYAVIAKVIDDRNPAKGVVAASFDLDEILLVLIGELVSDNLSFYLLDQQRLLFKHGELDLDAPVVEQHLSFAGRDWLFVIQSRQQGLHSALLVLLIGVSSALMMSLLLYRHLRREQQLSAHQQMYLAAANASLDAIALYSPQGSATADFKLKHTNARVPLLLQPAGQHLLQLSLKQQCQALGTDAFWSVCQKVFHSGQPFETVLAVDSPLLFARWLRVQVVRAGEGLAVTLRDITVRKTEEQLLKINEEKYRRLIEGIDGHFIYRMTAAGQIDFISNSVQDILGYQPADFCQHHQRYVRQEPANMAQIRLLLQQGHTPAPYMIEYLDATQQPKVIEYRERPMLDEQGQVLAIEGIGRDVTVELALQQKILFQADHDQLTGLLNRYAFDIRLKQLLSDAVPAILCYIDMDQFKLVNDSCGHLAGDELLRSAANILATDLAPGDMLARLGGDEFCLIYTGINLAQAEQRLQLLFERIQAFRFSWENKIFTIGASIGVLQLRGQTQNTVEILKAADSACYFARTAGRNRYQVVDTDAAELNHRQNELNLVSKIQQAIDLNQFELYFQAIVPLQGQGQGHHYEILLRLSDAHGQMLSPAVFIPLAERFGLMQAIDRWVFNQVLDGLEQQPHHVAQLEKVAINLSGLSLGDDNLLQHILQRFARSTVPPAKVCFEITETAAVTNMASADRFIQTLRQIGCRFSLDDFGAGMSSFTYLKNMPVDFVKIDGSFVRNMAVDATDYAMVKAIAEIAISLGKHTIAEFVSDDQVKQLLQELGVGFGQGFALHKPQPWQPWVQQSPPATELAVPS